MKRETFVAILLALLAVVALGVAAATLETAVSTDGGSLGGGGSGDGIGPSQDTDEAGVEDREAAEMDLTPPPLCAEFLREPPALFLLFGAFAALGGLAYRDTGSMLAATVVVGTIFLPVGGLWYLLSTCQNAGDFEPSIGAGENGEEGILPIGGGDGGLGGEDAAVSTPEALFLAVVVAALLASALILLAASGDDEHAGGRSAPTTEEPAETDPDLAELGRTAGAAADRIEGAAADNEVYRAWREMTDVLDVERPESSTPAEFADAAVAAGVDPDPVAQLTDVFERVRYGGADPTGDRERRAVDALRRIEDAHGGSE